MINICLNDPFSEYDLEDWKYDLIVYDYWCGNYEGSGFLVGKDDEGWFSMNLGHCSCNGPLNNDCRRICIKEFLEEDSSGVLYDESRRNVQTKLREILNENFNVKSSFIDEYHRERGNSHNN